MKRISKRYKLLKKSKETKKIFSIEDAISNLKKSSNAKFDESIDISLKLNLKQSKGGDATIRSVINLPHGSGKKLTVAVLCEQEKIQEAKKSGADTVGSDELLEDISKGKLNFNKLICTPKMMSKIGKYGKILGPKGLMPNPKLGTVASDIKKAVIDIKSGLIEIKNDKDFNLASSIGRKSFSKENLKENCLKFIENLKKEKPANIKGEFIKGVYLTSTMGLSYKVEA
tara:strand:- start:596 stop:1279 length:684 start_codon:yes stop_codon:yes gene_type:complete